MHRGTALVAVATFLFAVACHASSQDVGASRYYLAQQYVIGGEGGWDYLAFDSATRRLYIAHGVRVDIVNADGGKVLGHIENTPGVHGIALAPSLKRGYVSNGKGNSVTIFDSESFKTIQTVSVNAPDFILYDPSTSRVFPLNEHTTVLDAATGNRVGEVDLGGDPEAAVTDGQGTVYVNLADKSEVAVVGARSLKVEGRYPIEDCVSPHSLSYDAASHRLFVGCRSGFVALDAQSGKVVDRSIMCAGVDAAAFDSTERLVFESCSEGVMSVIQEVTPDDYELIDTVKSQLFARTMAFDPVTQRIFLATADVELVRSADRNGTVRYQERIRPGTFRVLVMAKGPAPERVGRR